LSEIEAVLTVGTAKAVFPKFVPDLTPAQVRMVEAYVARLRSQMVRVLASVGIAPESPSIGSVHALHVHLAFVRIAIQECAPNYLRGYGPVPDDLMPELDGLAAELERIVTELDAALGDPPGSDLNERLARLADTVADGASLKNIAAIIERHNLVELRAPLADIVDRISTPRYEIAFFGQVSSGKSSLLNEVIGESVLPVGVNPITAVPTRVVYSATPGVTVVFADRQVKHFPLGAVPDLVTEEQNPGNAKGVARLTVGLPSIRLRDGVVLVDTPGLGSLATGGAAETRAYLPQCDLGVVLINASTSISLEDIATIRSLHDAGIPTTVLLSKADLLTSGDHTRAIHYIAAKVESELGIKLAVHAVSIVGEDEALLDRWFSEELLPLYSRQRELGQASVRRKVGVLRESAARALEATLGRTPRLSEDRRAVLERADQDLRAASGVLATTQQDAVHAADRVRELSTASLESAATALASFWRNQDGASPREAVRAAIAHTAAVHVSETVEALEKVAAMLQERLRETANILGAPEPPPELDLQAVMRNMPQIDLSAVVFEAERPFAARFGKYAMQSSAGSSLRKQIGNIVDSAFDAYSRAWRNWIQTTGGKLRDLFDAQADTYRAQLARLLTPTGTSNEDREQTEADLKWLRTSAGARPEAPEDRRREAQSDVGVL
jgi:GTP-binding protein EngB required for normal cell division